MDDMNAFERQVAAETVRAMGPIRPVDDLAIFNAASAAAPRWTIQSMFGTTRLVVAGAVVALFGGVLLAGVLTQPSEESAPVVGASAPPRVESTTTTVDATERLSPAPGMFSLTGSLGQARTGHTATLLQDGRVLVVGGDGSGSALASSEAWDPASSTFSAAGSLAVARAGHTATLLRDGRVLVVGGPTVTAEMWSPATSSFGTTGALSIPRAGHTATLLRDGRVLIVGGEGTDPDLASAEVWDPTSEEFSAAGSFERGRAGHTATLLRDGRVLVVGGSYPRCCGRFETAMIWDPRSMSFSPAGELAKGRTGHTATLLRDGRVLILGGREDGPLSSGEVWDPETESFTPVGSMASVRQGHTATLLPDDRVLVIGGGLGVAGSPLAPEAPVAEMWDPEHEVFQTAASPGMDRGGHTATLLSDERVLIVGGDRAGDSAEIWQADEEPAG